MRPLQFASIGNKKGHWDVGQSPGCVQREALVSRTRGPVGNRVPPIEFPARIPTRAPWHRRPSRCPPFCLPSAHDVDWLSSSVQRRGGGGWRFPSMPSRGLSATALTQWRSPCRSAWFQAHHCLLCRSNDGVPATASKRYVLGRNRESRSRPGNCDFPGISIPNYHINNNSTFQQLWCSEQTYHNGLHRSSVSCHASLGHGMFQATCAAGF